MVAKKSLKTGYDIYYTQFGNGQEAIFKIAILIQGYCLFFGFGIMYVILKKKEEGGGMSELALGCFIFPPLWD